MCCLRNFVKVATCTFHLSRYHVIKDHVDCRDGYLVTYSDGTILLSYVFQPSLVIVTFNLPRDHVIKSHVTEWLHTISSFAPNLVYVCFFKL